MSNNSTLYVFKDTKGTSEFSVEEPADENQYRFHNDIPRPEGGLWCLRTLEWVNIDENKKNMCEVDIYFKEGVSYAEATEVCRKLNSMIEGTKVHSVKYKG